MLNFNELGLGVSSGKLLRNTNFDFYRYNSAAIPVKNDSFEINKSLNNIIAYRQRGKEMLVVSFTGLNDPTEKPAIQMKVRGVTEHQSSSDPQIKPKDLNIDKLASSDWYDGKQLNFKLETPPVKKDKKVKKEDKEVEPNRIVLYDPDYGEIGRVHDELAAGLIPLLKGNEKDYRFELSNIIAGTSKGAETTGLRVNLIYQGSDKNEPIAREKFDEILNSPACINKVLLYQPKTSIENVLKTIFANEENVKGLESVKAMKEVIQNIVNEIAVSQKVLLVGHCKPDGDTIGCVLGLKNAIALMDPSKKVDCAIDDKIPGLFRHKLPGIDDEIKFPHNPERIKSIQKEIEELKNLSQSKKTDEQIKTLNQELESMQNPDNLLDKDAEYDLVVLMDIPTPKRFTDKFKNYIENADKVIYVDHHPNRLAEWDDAASETGVNMQKIIDDKLALIADSVPSATELVAILAARMVPALSNQNLVSGKRKPEEVFPAPGQVDHLNAFVASIVAGTSTDTSSFTRTANLLPEHMKMPVQERPNFLPEGLCKWIMGLTGNKINKKWLREEISYDITEKKYNNLEESARNKMLKYAIDGKLIYKDLSLGIVQVNYDQMNDVWKTAMEIEPETTLLDVQNAFKYSEVMSVFNTDPSVVRKKKEKEEDDDKKDNSPINLHIIAKEDYEGSYDGDRIAVLICQDKKAGELNEKLEFAPQNGLRLSFRSQNGSIHSELLASMFGGGGHGGAAGGRVDLPEVELDSKLAVAIDGKIENNVSVICKELKHNYEVNHNLEFSKDEKLILCKKIEVIKDQEGKTCEELIKAVAEEIRKEQPKEVSQEKSKKVNKVTDTHNSK
ncbi:MAG: DHH family phosphoesterase, partial [Candidatus Gastranaerophilales bacterium]|nr:DHH family phosphoesterase [Candidatus Gastranaerophilales bacterium]